MFALISPNKFHQSNAFQPRICLSLTFFSLGFSLMLPLLLLIASRFDVSHHLHNVSVWQCDTITIDLFCVRISKVRRRTFILCERIEVWNWIHFFALCLFELNTKKKTSTDFVSSFYPFSIWIVIGNRKLRESLFEFGSKTMEYKTFPYSLIIIMNQNLGG